MASRRWTRVAKSSVTQISEDLDQSCKEARRVYLEGSPTSSQQSINVVWHKWTDLRLLDHEPLHRAHARKNSVLHVHLVELPLLAGFSRVGRVPRCSGRRKAFWRESVADLSKRLEDCGQHLLVRAVEKPSAFFAELCKRFPIASVFVHAEFCDEELKTEASVREVLAQHGARLETFWGGLTVVHIDDLGFNPADPKQMPQFKGEFNGIAKKRKIREVLPVPNLQDAPELDPSEYGESAIVTAFSQGPRELPPDQRQPFVWAGGETAALQHLKWYIETDQLPKYRGATESFAHGDHNPVNGGTRMSPWLAFGCVTARMLIHEARKYERQHGKSSSTGKGSGKMGSTGARLHTELNFRDFLRFSALSWGTNLFKEGGPFQISGVKWSYDQELFAKWKAGETGYPFVDAGMRELALTGYISHLHRQCCAAFLVRDLRLDWRMGAEHFESCLLDHTPDANWGNWSYRILMRPGLVESRNKFPVEKHITTVECIAWPAVHDAYLEHTLRWLPELTPLPRDLVREPWRLETDSNQRISVKPFKDSPLWFCAANRVNWDYEYFWLPGNAWTVRPKKISKIAEGAFCLGRDYPRPMVPALNLEIDLDALPVTHSWGDTPEEDRPHIWGEPGSLEKGSGGGQGQGKGKSKGKGKNRKGKADALRDAAYQAASKRKRADKKHSVASDFYHSQSWGA